MPSAAALGWHRPDLPGHGTQVAWQVWPDFEAADPQLPGGTEDGQAAYAEDSMIITWWLTKE
jgi:hypothetical protein